MSTIHSYISKYPMIKWDSTTKEIITQLSKHLHKDLIVMILLFLQPTLKNIDRNFSEPCEAVYTRLEYRDDGTGYTGTYSCWSALTPGFIDLATSGDLESHMYTTVNIILNRPYKPYKRLNLSQDILVEEAPKFNGK